MERLRIRLWRLLPAFLLVAAVVQGCVVELGLTDEEAAGSSALVRFAPEIDPLLAAAANLTPPARLEIEVRDALTNEIVHAALLEPGEDGVFLPVELRVDFTELGETLNIDGFFRILGASADVEWSGRFGPVALAAGEEPVEVEVEMGRGDLPNLEITAISVSIPEGPFLEGMEVPLEVEIFGPEGARLFWHATAPEVVAVDPAATTLATLAPGSAEIVIMAGKNLVRIPVEVAQRVARIEIHPAHTLLTALGDEVELSYRLLDPRGVEVQGRSVAWSGGEGVVESTGSGVYRAVAEGGVEVRVANAEAEGAATIEVRQEVTQLRIEPENAVLTAFGDAVNLEAVALDANGHRVTSAFPFWSDDGSGILALNESGRAEALMNGTSQVTALVNGIGASASVQVAQQLEDLILDPGEAELPVGESMAFEFLATDRNGHPLAIPVSPRWSVADPAIASITPGGLATGEAPGQTTVRLTTAFGRSALARLSIVAEAAGEFAFDFTPGTGAPPATLDDYVMSPVPYPNAPQCTGIFPPLPTKGGGVIEIDPMETFIRCIGSGWATWSHGYAGDVYYSIGNEQTLTLPPGTRAFYFYVEPDPFSLESFEVIVEPGGVSSGPFTVHGDAGAAYVGVYATGAGSLESIKVIGSSAFSTGEYGWAGSDDLDADLRIDSDPAVWTGAQGGMQDRSQPGAQVRVQEWTREGGSAGPTYSDSPSPGRNSDSR